MSVLNIPADVESIVLDEMGVDDVAISLGGGMVRIERMSPGAFWAAVYMPDGRTHRFNFYAKKGTIRLQHEEEPAP